MRLVVTHPGASWATGDVHTGLVAGLRAGGHEVIEYALDGRLAASSIWLNWQWRRQVRHGGPLADTRPTAADIQYDAAAGLLERALRHEVDWVLVICAAYLHPDVLILARRAGLRLAAVFTESPYDDREQAKIAPLFDVCTTNERASVGVLRAANPHTHYVPVGYHPAHHGPESAPGARAGAGAPPVPAHDVPAHDVVFVGTAFESRLALLSAVDWTGIDLGLYGHWQLAAGHPLAPFVRGGLVDNARAGALYRAARIGLNLYREPGTCDGVPVVAESLNPRAYELAADGVCTISQPRAEVAEKFGDHVATFTTPQELGALVRAHLAHPDGANGRPTSGAALPPLVADDTYAHRAAQLVGLLAGESCGT
jgi:hypothetical protein